MSNRFAQILRDLHWISLADRRAKEFKSGSQWGGGFYGYRLKCGLFYGYRFIFFSYG